MKLTEKVLCNRADVLAAAQPRSAVEHISFSPNGGWLIRFVDGKVQHQSFPLAGDLVSGHPGMRQHSRVKGAVFGAEGSSIIRTERATLVEGVSEEVRGLIKVSEGGLVGKASTLCPSSKEHFFIEQLSTGEQRSKYRYNMPPSIPPGFVASLIAGEHPNTDTINDTVPACNNVAVDSLPPPAYEHVVGSGLEGRSEARHANSPQVEHGLGSPSHPEAKETVPGGPSLDGAQARVNSSATTLLSNRPHQANLVSGMVSLPQTDTSVKAKVLSLALVCRQCQKGLAPGDMACYCDLCGDSLCFCSDCCNSGSNCPHRSSLVVLGQDPNLLEKGATECYRCWRSIGRGDLMWHCEECLDPALCQKCWKKGKHCRHFDQGKVSLYVVKRKSSAGRYIDVAFDVAGAIFGF